MKILKVYQERLRFLNYSERTIDVYSCYLGKFLNEQNIKDPYQVTTKQIESYLYSREYTSRSKQNQIIGSLKLFAREVLGKSHIHLDKIKRPRKQKKLPKIIDAKQLASKINNIQNLKHKAILALGLSCGLRISEVINLKWEDIDRNQNVLWVINGKGNKDRSTKLTYRMIKILEDYWHSYKSKNYVFNGQNGKFKYSQSSIQKIFKKYVSKNQSFHYLRHCHGTFAIDQGTPLPVLQKSMGHNSIKTTEIYIHMSNKSLEQMKTAI